jgi:glycine betaine/proline transport system ATP-binding protein
MDGGRIVQSGEPEQVVLNPANDYVRDFVAHMNPIKVLRARSLMTPLAALGAQAGRIQLDWTGHHLLSLDTSGAPAQIDIEGSPGQLLPYTDTLDVVAAGLDGRSVVIVSPDTLLEKIIHIRHATGRPLLLCEDGRFIGVVGDQEIYSGMLRSTRL